MTDETIIYPTPCAIVRDMMEPIRAGYERGLSMHDMSEAMEGVNPLAVLGLCDTADDMARAIDDLVDWSAMMGGWEYSGWDRAAKAVQAYGGTPAPVTVEGIDQFAINKLLVEALVDAHDLVRRDGAAFAEQEDDDDKSARATTLEIISTALRAAGVEG